MELSQKARITGLPSSIRRSTTFRSRLDTLWGAISGGSPVETSRAAGAVVGLWVIRYIEQANSVLLGPSLPVLHPMHILCPLFTSPSNPRASRGNAPIAHCTSSLWQVTTHHYGTLIAKARLHGYPSLNRDKYLRGVMISIP